MIKEIEVKSVLNKTKKRDSWFLDDYTFNPYSSCSFNCLYCYIRGSQYGENLADKLSVKTNAIELLDKQLGNRAKKGQYGFIVLSSATDPYLQVEDHYGLTREALKIILKHRFPVHIITKSDRVVRDFDILADIDRTAILPEDLKRLGRGTIVTFSFSTLQDHIGKIFESGAVKPSDRLVAVETTQEAGFLSGISLMPLIPYISDTKEQLHLAFETFRTIGVDYVLPASITLFGHEAGHSRPLMLKAVSKHFPELEEKYRRFFSTATQMPEFYRTAFYEKMKELGRDYNCPNSILEGARLKKENDLTL